MLLTKVQVEGLVIAARHPTIVVLAPRVEPACVGGASPNALGLGLGALRVARVVPIGNRTRSINIRRSVSWLLIRALIIRRHSFLLVAYDGGDLQIRRIGLIATILRVSLHRSGWVIIGRLLLEVGGILLAPRAGTLLVVVLRRSRRSLGLHSASGTAGLL